MDEEEYDVSVVENVAAPAENAVISKDQEEKQSDDCSNVFQPRTFRPGSINSQRRAAILPAYPLARNDNHRVLLLLSNVANLDRDQCEKESFCGGNGFCPFEFKQHRYVEPIDSFMMDFYQDLFIKPSRQWKIHYSLIDYNLSRLQKCMEIYTKQTGEPALSSLNELSLALEFFLQIDVDIFFMKTCNFHGAHPRLFAKNAAATNETQEQEEEKEKEGILCEAEPTARYGMAPCRQRNCFLCEPQLRREVAGAGRRRKSRESSSSNSDELLKSGVQFSPNQIHRFVNKYEAILNCHVNCITSNIIYALTCPCGQLDFIGSTVMTFYDRILKHRDENNRIIREFLIGINNIDHILRESLRSAEKLANNNMLLYQHSPRCSLVLQCFLNDNPEYWCFVPMLFDEARVNNSAYASTSSSSTSKANNKYVAAVVAARAPQYPPESPTFVTKPPQFFESVLRNSTRSEEECIWLAKGVPKPPQGFTFSHRQIDEQIDFFKFKKEASMMCSHLIDCYKYTIIAVLPDDCSHELRRFIEALFITHAETKLNTIGRLTHKGTWPSSTTSFDHANRGQWCKKLVRSGSSGTKKS